MPEKKIYRIKVDSLRDLILIAIQMPLKAIHLIREGDSYKAFIFFQLVPSRRIIVFELDNVEGKLIESRFIVYNSISGEYSFTQKPVTSPNVVHIPIIRIKEMII